MTPEQVIERERRWARPVATMSMGAVVLIFASIFVARAVTGGGQAEVLRSSDAHRSALLISSFLQAFGFGLLMAPLLFLFRAAQARSPRVRGQLVGVVIAAPLFLAASGLLSGITTLDAAADFVAQGVTGTGDHANKIAQDSLDGAATGPLALGFGLGGRIGFTVAMIYSCLWGMRTGLLPRLGGSLGIALGAVSFLFLQFTATWFVYFAFLIAGRQRGGRPPAWDAGVAIPLPSPGGGQAGGGLFGGRPPGGAGEDGDAVETSGEEATSTTPTNPPRRRGERRKRKRRQ